MVEFMLMFSVISTNLDLPKDLLRSVCYVETKHKVHAVHKNDGGEDSLGICQIKLSTARQLGFKGSRKELMTPFNNAYYAGAYLKHQINRYGAVHKAIVAYNVGHYTPKYTRYLNKVMKVMKEGQ